MRNVLESMGMPKYHPEETDDVFNHFKNESKDLEATDNMGFDQAIIDISRKPMHQVNLLSREVVTRMNELRDKDFAEASNWTELYATIVAKGSLEMGGQSFNPSEVIDIIDKIRNNKLPLTNITRSNGLRNKVEALLGD